VLAVIMDGDAPFEIVIPKHPWIATSCPGTSFLFDNPEMGRLWDFHRLINLCHLSFPSKPDSGWINSTMDPSNLSRSIIVPTPPGLQSSSCCFVFFNITVSIGNRQRIDLNLKVGAAETTVEVTNVAI
jgi:hypothetical protein